MFTPQTARQAGSIGGLVKASRYSKDELTGKARQGFLRRFLIEVDPSGTLPEAERQRRATAALRAHMRRVRLGKKSPSAVAS